MQIQKHLAKKIGKKKYYKYVIVLPEKLIKKAEFKVKEKLEGTAKKGEVKLKKK